ncbi:MAG: alpha/beta hydrolase [Clostridiaceae bacterium]
MKNRIIERIDVEGDSLFYKITGTGKPLILIPGAGGDGDLYLPLADELSKIFKVITYDRRANARSTMNNPNNFDIKQQARDVKAILEATQEKKAYIFGNSSGAIIALEFIKNFPDSVLGAIIHEAPVAKLHDNSQKWCSFFKKCYDASFKIGGSSWSATKFLLGIEVPAMQMIKAQIKATKYLKNELKTKEEKKIASKDASKFLIRQELLPITNYDVDIESLKKHSNKIVVAVGDYAKTKESFLYNISVNLANVLNSKLVIVPGHHGSFMDNEKEWAKALNNIIDSLN